MFDGVRVMVACMEPLRNGRDRVPNKQPPKVHPRVDVAGKRQRPRMRGLQESHEVAQADTHDIFDVLPRVSPHDDFFNDVRITAWPDDRLSEFVSRRLAPRQWRRRRRLRRPRK